VLLFVTVIINIGGNNNAIIQYLVKL